MGNPCIKTGANVYLTGHGGYLHGDLFHVGNCYYLRYVGDVGYSSDVVCFAEFDTEVPENECLWVRDTILIQSDYVRLL